MDAPHVSHKDAPVPAAFPSVQNKTGGVIRHRSSGSIGLASSDDEGSKWDRADGDFTGPQSVAAPKAAPDTGGLPAEWLGREAKGIEHD